LTPPSGGARRATAWPLGSLRVLDLSTEIAGPYATKLFADGGADVLKIEPVTGDPLRRWTASDTPLGEGRDGPLFQFLNAGKRSACLDLALAGDRERVLALAAGADLIVESFGPDGLERLGLGFEILAEVNPSLSVASISPFGRTGPWANRPATEWTLQAAIGMTARRGLPERGPVGCGGRVGDWVAGSYAAVGALVAVLSAWNTGRGQHVDLSTFEAMLLCMTQYHDFAGQLFGTPLPQYVDTPSIEPARDGWVGFATITAQQWKDFCAMVGRPDVAEIKRYFHTDERMKDLDFIHGIIRGWTRERSVDEIVALASAMRIPVAPIGDGRSLPTTDHFVARGAFEEYPGGFVAPRVPYRLETAPARPPRPAPRLGESASAIAWDPARRAPRGGGALPFAGLRVVDLSAFWAGPFVTCHLAALGADVIKVESVQRPDGMRFVNALKRKDFYECGAIFHGANPGKRGITLKLDSEEGRALLERLVAGADVLVENFSVRVLENLGLAAERLRAANPRLVIVRMPSWGLDGPWRDRVGWAMNVEQASGLAWLSGYEDLPLVVNLCDAIGGLHGLFALALALEHRRRTGEGQIVEVPLVEPGLNLAAEQVIEYSAHGRLLTREGNRGPAAAPQGVYACAGEGSFLALAVASDQQWRGLRAVLGAPTWSADPALDRHPGRRAAHDAIDRELGQFFASRDRDEAVAALLAAGVPAHPLVNAHFVMPNPQLEHREFFQELEHPVLGRRRYPGLPMRFTSLGPAWHGRPPPTLGQHNAEVLGSELGLSPDDLARLEERQIIGTRPRF
jgi:crotonobetainyl-CoA:carnitine CoA-transferase CaiB-like acyl-CoA transferase